MAIQETTPLAYQPSDSERSLDYKRKMAQLLMQQGMSGKPIEAHSQGLAQMANAALGGYMAYKADADQTAGDSRGRDFMASLLMPQGGAAPTSIAPPAQSAVDPASAVAPMSKNTPPLKIYSQDEPNPMDPPSGRDRDLAIRTMYGEDPGKSALGVANVIRKRAISGQYGGDTPSSVVLAPGQFEPWANPAAKARMMGLKEGSPEYERLGGVLESAYAGNDPTGGATHFYSPGAQAALGRPTPSWAKTGGQDIGPHRFFGGAAGQGEQPGTALAFSGEPSQPVGAPQRVAQTLGGQPQAIPQTQPPPMMPQGQPPVDPMRAKIVEALRSKDPFIAKAAQGMATQLLQKQFEGEKPTDDMREHAQDTRERKAAGLPPRSLFDFITSVKKSGATKVSMGDKIEAAQEGEYEKVTGKQMAELNAEIPKAASAARNKLAKIDRMTQLLSDPTVNTGAGAESILELKRIAKTMGIDVGDLGGSEAVRAIGNEFALELRNPSGGAGMPGAMSDKDREFLQTIPPGLAKTPEGNALMADYLKRVAQRSLDVERLRQQYVRKNKRLDEGFYTELADFSDANPIFSEAKTVSPAQGSPIDDLLKKYGK